jgi:hypothetical protein
MTDHNDTGTDAGTTTDDSTERERTQTLDTAMDRSQIKRLQGRIDQKLADAFTHRDDEAEQDSSRFQRAVKEGGRMNYAVATSGAHGWQIEETDDGGLRLVEGAYPEDVSWLVFENGWIHRTGAYWLQDEDLAEWVDDVQARRDTASDRIQDAEREAFEADDRIQYEKDATGEPMKGWWRFEPTGYVGRPEAVVAHADGYDARTTTEAEA